MDSKVNDLSQKGTLDTTDVVYVVDNATTAADKKATPDAFNKNLLTTDAETAATVTIVNRLIDPGNIIRYGADPTGVTDSLAAIDFAIAQAQQGGAQVFIPPGIYAVSDNILQNTSGVEIRGAGIVQTIIKPVASFPDTEVFTIGNKVTTATKIHCGLSDLTIDVSNDPTTIAVGFYGCRDGSFLKRLYAKEGTGTSFKFGMAGNGVGSAALKMNQGCVFEQLVAVNTTAGVTGSPFLIDGTYESDFVVCRALGSSVQVDGQVWAFSVGATGDCRGLKFDLCTGVHYDSVADSCVICYGEWARDMWDNETTGENIYGNVIRFDGGTASGSLLPANCRSTSLRTFASADPNILNPAVYFRAANSCRAQVFSHSSTKAWFEFAGSGGANDFNNYGEMHTTQPVEDLISSGMLVFGGSTNTNNSVSGIGEDDAGLSNGYKVEFLANKAGFIKTSLALPGIQAFGSGNATPSVRGADSFTTVGTTAITDLDDGEIGQTIKILAASTITITHGSPIQLSGGVNFDMVSGDTLTLEMFNDQVWEERARKQGAALETYTPSNVSTDRSYDANAAVAGTGIDVADAGPANVALLSDHDALVTVVQEQADVLGTLIADLQARNLIQ